MGNQMSVLQKEEDQENESEAETYKVAHDSQCAPNGVPVVVSTHTVQRFDEVDLGRRVQEVNVATSSPKTTGMNAAADANGKNLGKEANPRAPAAKSHFFLTLTRPVPGRTGDQATDSSIGSVALDVSPSEASADKGPSDSQALLGAGAAGHAVDKTPGPTTRGHQALPAAWDPAPPPPEAERAAPAKPKDSSFFDKFFKLDKGREEAPVDSRQEPERAERRDEVGEVPGASCVSHVAPGGEDLVGGKGKEEEIGTVSYSVPGDAEGLDVAKDSRTTETEESDNPIMSFFKTLVSPNKAETKKDPEDTASKAESVCDGQAKTSEIQAKVAKKKHLDSPRLGLAFRKFFKHKGAEKSPTTSADLKSNKANFTPQETPGAAKNPKGSNSPGHVQSVMSTETGKEGAKEKSGPASLPLGKLFWKKSVKEDSVPTGAEENVVCESPVEIIKSEEVDSALRTVDLSEGDAATPEPGEIKLGREDSKPPRTSLMAFLRQMSVKGDGGSTRSEEVNGKDSSDQTANSAEKPVTPPEPEPPGVAQKGKEASSKDRKAAAEGSKRKNSKPEAREPTQCPGPAAGGANSLQDGDKSQKRPEKRRQSLGGFFKGLGPKRMLDAQVQTDPVSIGPVGKSK
ncbi:breast carcinoma-amplified sequence 1 isoform X1 [Nycticebus coucang]|uniref:breast carcinoma-amplified sequence 1 isoform X1 n=1 Tax=Nycticebus coucang TaxID=9470 RepID=UPI00234C9629|nr:breast carcinoma-amplified sequence 1 isoform X1 [Nycticebus coucang]